MASLTSMIRDHNFLNGFKFVIGEFILSILIVLPFTIYYLLSARFLLGVAGIGIIANFCIYIIFAVQSLLRKEKSIGIGKLFSKKIRSEIRNKYPELDRLTLILTLTTIVPFAMTAIVLSEASNSKK
jgi:hypothetical protein